MIEEDEVKDKNKIEESKRGYFSGIFGGKKEPQNEEIKTSATEPHKTEEGYDLKNSQMLTNQRHARDSEKAAMRERQEDNFDESNLDSQSTMTTQSGLILENGDLPTIILPQIPHKIRG